MGSVFRPFPSLKHHPPTFFSMREKHPAPFPPSFNPTPKYFQLLHLLPRSRRSILHTTMRPLRPSTASNTSCILIRYNCAVWHGRVLNCRLSLISIKPTVVSSRACLEPLVCAAGAGIGTHDTPAENCIQEKRETAVNICRGDAVIHRDLAVGRAVPFHLLQGGGVTAAMCAPPSPRCIRTEFAAPSATAAVSLS